MPHALLGPGHLVAVDGVDQLVELAPSVRSCSRVSRSSLLAARAPLLDGAALGLGERDRLLEPGEDDGGAASDGLDRPGPRRSVARGGPAPWRARRARPARPWRRASARPCSARARSSAVRSASRASISPDRAARAASASCSRRLVSGSSSGDSSADLSRCSSSASPARSASREASRGLDGLVDPVRLGARRAGLGAVLGELLGDRGEGGVGLVQLRQRDVDPARRVGALVLERC